MWMYEFYREWWAKKWIPSLCENRNCWCITTVPCTHYEKYLWTYLKDYIYHTFEPIWLPHCPACKWIISRILLAASTTRQTLYIRINLWTKDFQESQSFFIWLSLTIFFSRFVFSFFHTENVMRISRTNKYKRSQVNTHKCDRPTWGTHQILTNWIVQLKFNKYV